MLLRSYIKMKFFLCIGIAIWYFVADTNAGEKALIFNYERGTLVSFPTKLLNTPQCGHWIFTCPGKKDEEYFEQKNSLYNKALYVKKVLDHTNDCRNFEVAICDKPYEISMAYSVPTEKFELGYEVFHRIETLFKYPSSSHPYYFPMKMYDKTVSYHDLKKKISKEMKRRKKEKPFMGYEMELLWIPLVKIALRDYKKFHYVEYEIRINNINPKPDCRDYSLGTEIIDPEVVDYLYSEEAQKAALKGVKLQENDEIPKSVSTPETREKEMDEIPEGASTPETREKESDEISEGASTPEYNYLIKWPLLPTDQFQFGTDSSLNCSNVTTIPIWKSTLEKIMDKLYTYLYTLQRITGQPFRIVAGVHEVLSISRKSIVLRGENFEIDTPKIIYMMVKFRLNPCERKSCPYGVLIVIHNGPNHPTQKDLICDKDLSEDLGWEEIQYETWSDSGIKSNFIYVCELTEETMLNVDITYKKKFERLNLKNFPIFDKGRGEVIFDDTIKKKVYDEMKRISNPDEKVELDSNIIIERPSIYDNFRTTHQIINTDDTKNDGKKRRIL